MRFGSQLGKQAPIENRWKEEIIYLFSIGKCIFFSPLFSNNILKEETPPACVG
jgi:hypothetical protein